MKIYADGADLEQLLELADDPLIEGFTTNPTLMRRAGVTDYEGFARKLIERVPDKPISFEVFADEFPEMVRQARHIACWGPNVYVKIPVTDTRGLSTRPVVAELSRDGIHLNVTALMSVRRVEEVLEALAPGTGHVVSVFAGRIADTGVDPVPVMAEAAEVLRGRREVELLWASPREVLNIIQAEQVGADIITVTLELLAKRAMFGKDLDQLSLETVQMFHRDAQTAGYLL